MGRGLKAATMALHILSFVLSFALASNTVLMLETKSSWDPKGGKSMLRKAGWKDPRSPRLPWLHGVTVPHLDFQLLNFSYCEKKIIPSICLSCSSQVCIIHSQTEFSTTIRHTLIEIQAKASNRQFNKEKDANME